ncbi:MAG: leucine-rich repeat domain-containing protein, partial [Muribaculaceae bacterium]|nr:leucine-rich repeat domain-containing protein [Muribaculaceae bacterium]
YIFLESIKVIEESAFENCGTIKELRLPENLERIEKSAFENTLIDTLYIPRSLVYIGEDAFMDCKIERVVFEDWKQWYANITLANILANPYAPRSATVWDWELNMEETVTVHPEIYEGDTQLIDFELPYDLTRIPDYVGAGISFRDEVEIPYGVKRIGAYAFYNNKELYHVFLNDALEEIGEHAFDGCELLENQELPGALNKIEDSAYKDCTSLTEVVLPENLSSLGANVFEGCSALEKAVLIANIDYIPDYAFYRCSALAKLYFPIQLKSIGDYAFADCWTIDEIKLPVSLETIGDYAFCKYTDGFGNITQLTIPDKVTSLGKHSFRGQSIQNLTLGKGLTTIPESAFEGNSVKSVIFSEGLQKIERNAFASGRDRVSSVILPSTITEIEENAFGGTAIQELAVPDGVLSLPSGSCGRPALLTVGKDVKTIDANAFSFDNLITFRLKATMPPTLNEAFPITNEQNDQLTLVVNQGRVVSYMNNARWKQINRIIQEDWTDIEVHLDGTFSLAEEIRMQNGLMPSQVNKMKVFGPLDDNDLRVIRENMVSLRSIDLSEVTNVAAIPDGQFKESLLNEIILPVGVERIGNESFADCRLLTMDALPETIASIGDRAFEGCIR